MKQFFSIILLAGIVLMPVAADFNSKAYLLDELQTEVFSQVRPDDEAIQTYYKTVAEIEGNKSLTEDEKTFLLARVAFYAGKIYMQFEDTDTAIAQNRAIQKNSFTTIKDYYDKKDTVISYFDKALALVAQLEPKYSDSSDLLWLKGSIISELCLLKDTGYIISNGPKALSLNSKALKINPNNLDALILSANKPTFSPPLFGGNPKKALVIFDSLAPKASEMNNGQKFDLYTGYAYAYGCLKDYKTALSYIDKSLELFPHNYFANALKILFEREDF